jgi:hypothetical protein
VPLLRTTEGEETVVPLTAIWSGGLGAVALTPGAWCPGDELTSPLDAGSISGGKQISLKEMEEEEETGEGSPMSNSSPPGK